MLYLGFVCWSYGLGVRMHILGKDNVPTQRSLSTRGVQAVIADSQVQKSGVKLFENVSGGRTLSGDLQENGKTTSFRDGGGQHDGFAGREGNQLRDEYCEPG